MITSSAYGGDILGKAVQSEERLRYLSKTHAPWDVPEDISRDIATSINIRSGTDLEDPTTTWMRLSKDALKQSSAMADCTVCCYSPEVQQRRNNLQRMRDANSSRLAPVQARTLGFLILSVTFI
ncbi:hypothetical protein CPLU01_12546 [Colletotrichum plurivorum]|uniref:Uncharacterized protein n=1 Tax=Colletotrichum plurivorum TaxID=2175906 RepID=A0A8H6JY49_9PEZI|nr:hypothetical protein CPLU01_12546 [Colletotrichum plurivorum]